jgi:hypothetical protein
MSSELERRLEGLLAAAPEPDPGAGEEALHRALQALRPAAPARRGLRAAVLVFAALVVLLAIAAGSLAAAGALRVSFGAKAKPREVPTQLSLPRGAHGIAAVVDGSLSVVTRGGFRMQGLPVSSAALSPHALYVAAGIGRSLVAMAPDGRRAWSHPAGGRVVAIAWAPDGLRIAYVVHTARRFALRVIWGNGTHDAVVDQRVRTVPPSWRSDSLAFAYVGVGGKAIVYDLAHASHHIVRTSARDVTSLAFAPRGRVLALGAPSGVWLIGAGVRGRVRPGAMNAGFGWLGPDLLAVANRYDIAPIRIGADHANRAFIFGGRIRALATGGYRFVAVVAGRSPRIVAGTRTHAQTVLMLPRGARVGGVAIG